MSIILIGFKGVGKTTLGKKIANLLRWEFLDTDYLIEGTYMDLGHEHKNVHEIHKELGEEGFRRIEHQSLKVLRPVDKQIIAVGGGTVINPDSVEILRGIGRFVYLAKDKDAIFKDLTSKKIPSFLNPEDLEGSFESMYHNRLAIFESLAEVKIDLSKHKEAEVLAKLYEVALKV